MSRPPVNSRATKTWTWARRACARRLSTRWTAARVFDLHASKLATDLTGDSIGTNILMLGYAAQQGLLPLSLASIQQAIRLNGTFVEGNLRTLALGRLAAHDPEALAGELDDKTDAGRRAGHRRRCAGQPPAPAHRLPECRLRQALQRTLSATSVNACQRASWQAARNSCARSPSPWRA